MKPAQCIINTWLVSVLLLRFLHRLKEVSWASVGPCFSFLWNRFINICISIRCFHRYQVHCASVSNIFTPQDTCLAPYTLSPFVRPDSSCLLVSLCSVWVTLLLWPSTSCWAPTWRSWTSPTPWVWRERSPRPTPTSSNRCGLGGITLWCRASSRYQDVKLMSYWLHTDGFKKERNIIIFWSVVSFFKPLSSKTRNTAVS